MLNWIDFELMFFRLEIMCSKVVFLYLDGLRSVRNFLVCMFKFSGFMVIVELKCLDILVSLMDCGFCVIYCCYFFWFGIKSFIIRSKKLKWELLEVDGLIIVVVNDFYLYFWGFVLVDYWRGFCVWLSFVWGRYLWMLWVVVWFDLWEFVYFVVDWFCGVLIKVGV